MPTHFNCPSTNDISTQRGRLWINMLASIYAVDCRTLCRFSHRTYKYAPTWMRLEHVQVWIVLNYILYFHLILEAMDQWFASIHATNGMKSCEFSKCLNRNSILRVGYQSRRNQIHVFFNFFTKCNIEFLLFVVALQRVVVCEGYTDFHKNFKR